MPSGIGLERGLLRPPLALARRIASNLKSLIPLTKNSRNLGKCPGVCCHAPGHRRGLMADWPGTWTAHDRGLDTDCSRTGHVRGRGLSGDMHAATAPDIVRPFRVRHADAKNLPGQGVGLACEKWRSGQLVNKSRQKSVLPAGRIVL